MKNLLIVTILFATTIFSYANGDSLYMSAMEQATTELEAVETVDQLTLNINSFERIANVKNDEWLPAYYLAYDYIILSFMDKEGDRDGHLDKAQMYVDKAMALTCDSVEVMCLQAYLYQGRLSISVMMRGAKYGPKVNELLNKAIAMDSENPRAHMLLGQNIYFTPSFFGGGADNACPHIQTAAQKFEQHIPASSIHPNWGQGSVNRLVGKCSAE